MKKQLYAAGLFVGLILSSLVGCQRSTLPIPPLDPTTTSTSTQTIAMNAIPTVTLTASGTPTRTAVPGSPTSTPALTNTPPAAGTKTPTISLTGSPTPSGTGTYCGGEASYYASNCSSDFYCTGAGFPGCTAWTGSQLSPAQYIVAMNSTDLGSLVNCNQCIRITDTANGNSIVAQVIDECPGCDGLHGAHSLDLDPSAAQALDPTYLSDGVFPVCWSVTSCAATQAPTAIPTSTPTLTNTPTAAITKTPTSPATSTPTPSGSVYSGGEASYYASNCNSDFYCTGAGFPGCTAWTGSQLSPAQYIVAMNSTDLGSIVACNQCIQITDTSDGNSIIAKVIDECPGCDGLHGPHSLDLDPSAAQALDPNYINDGIFPVSWSVTSCPP